MSTHTFVPNRFVLATCRSRGGGAGAPRPRAESKVFQRSAPSIIWVELLSFVRLRKFAPGAIVLAAELSVEALSKGVVAKGPGYGGCEPPSKLTGTAVSQA